MIRYGSGNLAVNLLTQAFATFATFYYIDHLGVDPALIGLAMVVHGALNAVLNPLVGHLSDRTRSRWGRRVPYITVGMAPLAATFALIWVPLVDGSTARFWYFLVVVLVYDVLHVVVVLNYVALFPEMFVTIAERAKAASWRQLFGIIGMIVGVAAAPMLYPAIGWPAMGAAFAVVALVFFALSLTGSKERVQDAREHFGFMKAVRYTLTNRAFLAYVAGGFLLQVTFALLQAGIPFFTKYALGQPDSANTLILGAVFVTAIPLVYVWSRVTTRVGPRRAVLAAIVVYGLGLAPFLMVGSLPLAVATGVAVGAGIAGMMVLLEILLAEVIDDDERRTGLRREGMYMGMNGFIVRWSASLQAVLLAVVLSASGYRAGAAQQPESVVTGVRLLLGGVPLVVLALAFLCFVIYPIRLTGRADPAVQGEDGRQHVGAAVVAHVADGDRGAGGQGSA
ncbi:MFS transporter [Nonomuraea soli]|uniref:GPH family glycoside/pentoside/hexuronide:cation symporter n=1 Tax=Nonomuraea soli TaxID=1032476 RepID=A0A7W0CMG8_9ACTN|nr:MFS transporter [Nonomuraea soli]MBA2893744.1 GPH family glycoside/pentoside/hexuronide:cation symporter [Nonomuraea soli]